MSRVGNKPITVPRGVQVLIEGSKVTVNGPKGELTRSLHPDMAIFLKGDILTVSRPTDSKTHRSLHGLTRSLLANMVEGVSQGFKRNLVLQGVGYRALKSGDKLVLQVGYTKPVEIIPPSGISFAVESPTQVSVSGIDKELVGGMAAQIRTVRPPNPYLGKGIRYSGEQLKLKAGKTGKIGKKK